MDWTQFPEVAISATIILTSTGIVGASAAEFVKQVVNLFGTKVPSHISAAVSGAVSGILAAFILYQQGIPLVVSILGVLVALFAPQPVYDVVRRIKGEPESGIVEKARILREAWNIKEDFDGNE